MDIIKANEARKISDEKQTNLIDTQLDVIMTAIKNEAEKGEYSVVVYDKILNQKVTDILIEAGYGVDCVSYRNGPRTVISWEEK